MDYIHDCLAQLQIFVRLIKSIVKKLDEHENRLYRAEETIKMLKARMQNQEKELQQLTLTHQRGESS